MKRIPAFAAYALLVALVAATALSPDPAHAYVGPGAGLTALGTVVALVAALALALVGFVWYPLKRMLRRPAASEARPDPDGRRPE